MASVVLPGVRSQQASLKRRAGPSRECAAQSANDDESPCGSKRFHECLLKDDEAQKRIILCLPESARRGALRGYSQSCNRVQFLLPT